MDTKKIENLSTTIKSLDTARFYQVNGHGIISFKSDINFMISRSAVCYMNNKISSKESLDLIEELNEVIKPVLDKYKKLAEEELKQEVNK